MDAILTFLTAHGVAGMFVAAFLAGSILPLASEVVLAALLVAGVPPMQLLLSASVGNTLGSITNYGIGRLGKENTIEHWLKIKPKDLERGKKYVRRFGFWGGLLAWVPVIGELITVAMGYLRTNFIWTAIMIFIGKFARYWIIIATLSGTVFLFSS